MCERSVYNPEEVEPLYSEIVPAYQEAFKGYPWYEVSKCVDDLASQRCAGGLSLLEMGELCTKCGNCPAEEAYTGGELIERFNRLGTTRPTSWYVERENLVLALAAVAWSAPVSQIASEKYLDVPEMKDWLISRFDGDIIWLDEVFANKIVRAKGNLRSFGSMITGLANRLNSTTVAYRTISPAMISAPIRDFGGSAKVLGRGKDVPDRRDFVIINLEDWQ